MTHQFSAPLPVSGIGQIDLDSHAVIEASAGTGKTYTIENLVVELLKSARVVNLEEILVVTFTEKAAGELKDRIRQNIKNELKRKPCDILQVSLDNFDSASIFTIHGFCNATLQDYAFENGEQFQSQLADDRAVYETVLYDIMRNEWPLRFGKDFQKILILSGYPGTTAGGISPWVTRVLDVAVHYQPSGNDILVPDGGSDLIEIINKSEKECRRCLDELERLIGPIDGSDFSKSDFPARYATLNINKSSMGKRLRIIEKLLKLLSDRSIRTIELVELDEFFSGLDLDDSGFNEFNTRWKKEGPDYNDKLPQLPDIIAILERLRALDIKKIRNMLTAITVRDIKRHALQYKKERGLISYDDMITRVCHALGPGTSTLKKVLQKKYRYALVDEFQDTDMLQWKIFSTIFLGSRTNRLFIIGDPKQSIYGFRGADVHAYYLARDEMIHSHGAHYYCLNENWRSSPDLIASFNSIFAGNNWFSDINIHYLPSRYPAAQDPGKHRDDKSLIVMDCGACTGTLAKYRSAYFIASELKRLISEDPSVDLNDIAILVTKWKEAETIEKLLKRHSISYSLYKKEGLYQSKEVLELQLVLTAIANPHDIMARKKALITRFFRIPVHQLYHYAAAAHDQPADSLFEKWITLADQRKWPLLFQSIIEDTGILFCRDIDDHDRALINYRTVMQNLEIEAYRNDFSIQEIIDYLNGLRQKNSFSHDSYNIQTIDLDKPGVQILTIHASKGLQFKTVFIAGGYTKKNAGEFWTYHDATGRVFDLVRNSAHKELYSLESASEEERLFYVALTRAQDRLYIPVFEPVSRSKGTAGMAGTKLHSTLNQIRMEQQVTWLDISSAHDVKNSVQHHSASAPDRLTIPDPLFPLLSTDFFDRRIHIDSFSGIKNRLLETVKDNPRNHQFGDQGLQPHDDDEQYTATGPALPVYGTRHELPHSKETGIMLHSIFEQIDFQIAGNAASPSDLITGETRCSNLFDRAIRYHLNVHSDIDRESIKIQIADIIWNTLNAPLNGSDLYLKNVDKKIHEVEFYYPSTLRPSTPVPGTGYREGFLHGFIDLIFRFQDKYFILDWKSNYLEEGYSRDRVAHNILDMHYDLQMNIYLQALLRWLRLFIPDYQYDFHFGGIYYLYLRGMEYGNPHTGIYFYRPAYEEIRDLPFA
ncbi:MAG TPA: UvrD-helicase domain-containing protein [Spirochaetota bacterium]|nr:UvrD-helicase domain-containing protein [Spirochaetota bacterium]